MILFKISLFLLKSSPNRTSIRRNLLKFLLSQVKIITERALVCIYDLWRDDAFYEALSASEKV